MWKACFQAAVDAGLPANRDSNGATAEGTSWNDMNVVDGVRQSAADGNLKPAADRPNLTVRTGAHARRLIIEQKHCKAAEYALGGQGRQAC